MSTIHCMDLSRLPCSIWATTPTLPALPRRAYLRSSCCYSVVDRIKRRSVPPFEARETPERCQEGQIVRYLSRRNSSQKWVAVGREKAP
ncbi:hypothetical protein J6590_013292 [Homalodisca vitripennis]|nr:hypothetical protein J6590_013292 [Homalodisca vitripennis]